MGKESDFIDTLGGGNLLDYKGDLGFFSFSVESLADVFLVLDDVELV